MNGDSTLRQVQGEVMDAHDIVVEDNESVGGKSSYDELWDGFPVIVDKLKRRQKTIRELHVLFKSLRDSHKSAAKDFSKNKIDVTNVRQLADPLRYTLQLSNTQSDEHAAFVKDTKAKLLVPIEFMRKTLIEAVKAALKKEKKLRSDLSKSQSAAKSAKEKDRKEKMRHEKLQIQLINSDGLTPAKIDKIQKNSYNAEISQKKAEKMYRNAVEHLHEQHSRFYRELAELLVSLENLDRDLLTKTKEVLNSHAEMEQRLAMHISQSVSTLQGAVDDIDIGREISDFVDEHRTGEEPSDPVPFDPYVIELPDHIENEHLSNDLSPIGSSGVIAFNRNNNNAHSQSSLSSKSPEVPAVDEQVTERQGIPQKTVKVLFDHEPSTEHELAIVMGDVITVYDEGSDGWWEGTLPDGRHGLFPSNFVQLIGDTDNDSVATEVAHEPGYDEEEETIVTESQQLQQEEYEVMTAMYDYEAQRESELNIHAGVRISVIEQNDDGWWMGQLESGETGLFPSNYTERR